MFVERSKLKQSQQTFTTTSEAIFSPCKKYRYVLTRVWNKDKPSLVWLMLNPSVADHIKNDRTVSKCIKFAKIWGYGGITVLNIFALRSTDPKQFYKADDPVGPKNTGYIFHHAANRRVVVAWGTHGKYLNRGLVILEKLKKWASFHEGMRVVCLGTTKDGFPKHPLFVKGDTEPIKWEW